jgi:NAD(P) transhydrogenase subunit alpha
MKIAIPKERRPHERRVAATPETVKKLIALGFEVSVETGAGDSSRFMDEAYRTAGASVVADAAKLLGNADIVLKVQRPLLKGEGDLDELALLKKGALLIGVLSPYNKPA